MGNWVIVSGFQIGGHIIRTKEEEEDSWCRDLRKLLQAVWRTNWHANRSSHTISPKRTKSLCLEVSPLFVWRKHVAESPRLPFYRSQFTSRQEVAPDIPWSGQIDSMWSILDVPIRSEFDENQKSCRGVYLRSRKIREHRRERSILLKWENTMFSFYLPHPKLLKFSIVVRVDREKTKQPRWIFSASIHYTSRINFHWFWCVADQSHFSL